MINFSFNICLLSQFYEDVSSIASSLSKFLILFLRLFVAFMLHSFSLFASWKQTFFNIAFCTVIFLFSIYHLSPFHDDISGTYLRMFLSNHCNVISSVLHQLQYVQIIWTITVISHNKNFQKIVIIKKYLVSLNSCFNKIFLLWFDLC